MVFEIFNDESDKLHKPKAIKVGGTKLEPGTYTFTLQSIEELENEQTGAVVGILFTSEEGHQHRDYLLKNDGTPIVDKNGVQWKKARLLNLLAHYEIEGKDFSKMLKTFEKLAPTLTLKVTENKTSEKGYPNTELFPSELLEAEND